MNRYILIYGFTIFSMFFGSGNLVFPLQIGMRTGNDWFLGFIGLFLTGVLLPFLGLFVVKLHKGSYEDFFGDAGILAQRILPLFTLSLLGAFGVVPRCITVAFGGVEYIYPNISLELFSVVFCILCFVMCLTERIIISVLGKWLTPILLLCLIILITLGVINATNQDFVPEQVRNTSSLWVGFVHGYETMDLFAAFFFSSLIFKQLQARMIHSHESKNIMKFAVKASLIGAALLAFVYLGFVFLGSHYRHVVGEVAPELILPAIATHVIGRYASLLIAVTVIFSCLTTAIALNGIYARYIFSALKLQEKWFVLILLCTTCASFFVSLLDFKGIAAFLVPLLELSYPSLIALTFLSIIVPQRKRMKTIMFYLILILTICVKYF